MFGRAAAKLGPETYPNGLGGRDGVELCRPMLKPARDRCSICPNQPFVDRARREGGREGGRMGEMEGWGR
jgi:hypothetical protein